MARRKIKVGSSSVEEPIFASDTSSTTGGGLSGLVYNTSGLVAEYRRQGQSSWTAITLVAGTLGTYASGGFVADGALAGAYALCPPDACFAGGAKSVQIRLRGATNMLPTILFYELDAVDYQDGAAFGLTSLTAIVARLGAITGSGLNTVLGYFRAIANKLAGLTPSDLTSGGGTFDNAEDSLEAARDQLATAPTAEAIDVLLSAEHGDGDWSATAAGAGNTAVDHNTGGADNLQITVSGAGVDGADVKAYLASDYAAGNRGRAYVKGQTATGPVSSVAGRMLAPMYLTSSNTYTIVFYKAGYLETSTKDVAI